MWKHDLGLAACTGSPTPTSLFLSPAARHLFLAMGSSGQEEAPGIFWAWVEGASGNMALALTTLVEQVQSWAVGVGLGGLTFHPIMDTLGSLLVGWMLFVTLILILGTFFYFKFIHHLENDSNSDQDDTTPSSQGHSAKGKGASEGATKTRKEEPARKPTIVPDKRGVPVSAPIATGADPDAVKWTNNVFTWLFNSAEGEKVMKKLWLDTINENTVKTAIEVSVIVLLLLLLLCVS